MDRVQQNAPATISYQWLEGDDPVDPGVVTVQVDRADETNLLPAGTATSGTSTDPRTFALSAANTATLDRLKVTWTSPAKGSAVTYVEIVGGFVFTLQAVRAKEPFDDQTAYPDADLVAMRTLVEQELERACGFAFVPRYEREPRRGDGTQRIELAHRKVRRLRSASVNGVALTVDELAAIVIDDDVLTRSLGWAVAPLVIAYEHGTDEPSRAATRAALRLARHLLIESPIDARAKSVRTDAGTLELATDGEFGIPEVDAFVGRHARVDYVF